MKKQGDLAQKSYSQDGNGYAPPQVRPYLGTIMEAQVLAELGALALAGDAGSHQKLLAEIERLKQVPKLFNVVARDLVRIRITKDGLPVYARIERDDSGNVASLKFDSREDLEKAVRGSKYRYSERIAETGMRANVALAAEEIVKQTSLQCERV